MPAHLLKLTMNISAGACDYVLSKTTLARTPCMPLQEDSYLLSLPVEICLHSSQTCAVATVIKQKKIARRLGKRHR